MGTFKVFDLPPRPLFGGGGESPNYFKNYWDYLNNMYPTKVRLTTTLSRLKIKGGGGEVVKGPCKYNYYFIAY